MGCFKYVKFNKGRKKVEEGGSVDKSGKADMK